MADLAKVDKVIIAQDSIQHFIDSVSPGAYASITKVNFKALDRFMIKPLGVYGPKDEIIRLLVHGRHRRRCVSAISANYYPVLNFFIRACLLLAPADYGDSQPNAVFRSVHCEGESIGSCRWTLLRGILARRYYLE